MTCTSFKNIWKLLPALVQGPSVSAYYAAPLIKMAKINLGNTKLGAAIWSWSLPASARMCPGASAACKKACYAKRGHFLHSSVRNSYLANQKAAKSSTFTRWMTAQLQASHVKILRIHVSGDFYSAAYIRKWIAIVRQNHQCQFFAYTRSWRKAALQPLLAELAALPNMALWYSADMTTGTPPPGLRAYMAVSDIDATTVAPDYQLVFRVNQRTPLKRVNGMQVCPAENGVSGQWRHTCTSCGLCWNKKKGLVDINQPAPKIQLFRALTYAEAV